MLMFRCGTKNRRPVEDIKENTGDTGGSQEAGSGASESQPPNNKPYRRQRSIKT